MSYTTNGNYQQWGQYLVGYKVVRGNGTSQFSGSRLTYRPGHWVKAKYDSESDGAIYHAAELQEVVGYWQQFRRVVRLLIPKDSMIDIGQAEKAFVQAMSEPLLHWPELEQTWPEIREPTRWGSKVIATDVKEQLPLQLREANEDSGWTISPSYYSSYYSSPPVAVAPYLAFDYPSALAAFRRAEAELLDRSVED